MVLKYSSILSDVSRRCCPAASLPCVQSAETARQAGRALLRWWHNEFESIRADRPSRRLGCSVQPAMIMR